MTIGQRVKKLRLMRGFPTQAAFAAALGVAQSYVHKIETGDDELRVRTLKRIADKLEVKAGALLDEDDFESFAANKPPIPTADAKAEAV